MKLEELIEKLQKVENKKIEVVFLNLYSGEFEGIELVGMGDTKLILGTNDIIDEQINFLN